MSWKTTLCGVIGLLAAIVCQFYPEHTRHGLALSALASGLGLIFARDNNKSSEDVGAGSQKTNRILSMAVLALSCVALEGCASGPQEAAYKAAGSAAIGADHAMMVWGDYVRDFNPPLSEKLMVKQAYENYQQAMFASVSAMEVYLAATDETRPDAKSRADAAAQAASQTLADLVSLIRGFGAKL